jgi:hypothetical protein
MLSRLMARSMAVNESVATCWEACDFSRLAGRTPAGTRAFSARLMPQPSAAAVNHDANLADAVDAHLVRRPRVKDFVDNLARVWRR